MERETQVAQEERCMVRYHGSRRVYCYQQVRANWAGWSYFTGLLLNIPTITGLKLKASSEVYETQNLNKLIFTDT